MILKICKLFDSTSMKELVMGSRLRVNYFEKVIHYIQLHWGIVQLNYNYMAFEQSN